MKEKPVKIAVTGKGGVGKTVITTLLAKILSQSENYKLLLIDADPTHPHLSNMVKLIPLKSLEEVRLDAVKKAHQTKKDARKLAERIDFNVYDAMAESKDFCLFSIGQPEGPGCFCPSNALLRKVIESISKDFDIILVDCEAGLEQINRMVLKSVDFILIITDISLRSIETANSIRKSAKKYTNYKKIGVIINKVKGDITVIINKLKKLDLPILGQIPEDQTIVDYDLEGKPIYDIPHNSESYKSIKKMINRIIT
ncbi:MAG: AAA family ATPase [Candidatus Hermodarchaeota archaeon]